MAADLIMPTLPGNQPQSSHHFYPRRPHHSRSRSHQMPPGPQLSPNSHADFHHHHPDAANHQTVSSPPSPKAYHARQVRPLYMPAALRPNDEFPSRPSTKSRSVGDSSSDSGSEHTSTTTAATLRRSNTGFMSLGGLGGLGQRLSRRSTGDSDKSVGGDWNLDLFPEVTEPPTRKHWKPDTESTICDDPTCKRNFSYFVRRHHCRKCGNIFCDWHSSNTLPLDQDANFNPRAEPSRSCNHCFEQFKQGSRPSAAGFATPSSLSLSSGNALHHPVASSTPILAQPGTPFGLPQGPEVPASVPRDWNWSTF